MRGGGKMARRGRGWFGDSKGHAEAGRKGGKQSGRNRAKAR